MTVLEQAPRFQVAPAQQTPYHLTAEQIAFFDANGYLVLRQWITGELLERLQAAGHAWIAQGMALDPNQPKNEDGWEDYAFALRGDQRLMYRVNYLHNKDQVASLELLGCPQVLAVAESLCGRNFVPTYESMVFKQEGDGKEIIWHQDAIHPRNYRIFNFDLYLDPSLSGAGALRVVPGTQNQKQDFCGLTDTYGWEIPESIEVEMEPGDVLLHDVMVAHGSPETYGKALRRTIYYEFRAAEEILLDGPWDREWIDRRLRLVPIALERYRDTFGAEPQFSWNPDDEFRPLVRGNEQEELKVAHLVHTSSAFCSAGDATRS
jgi:ectoine hydroxylase-related dioxygenase (phytanoyl-CoA dioxygenase family)